MQSRPNPSTSRLKVLVIQLSTSTGTSLPSISTQRCACVNLTRPFSLNFGKNVSSPSNIPNTISKLNSMSKVFADPDARSLSTSFQTTSSKGTQQELPRDRGRKSCAEKTSFRKFVEVMDEMKVGSSFSGIIAI